MRRLALWLLLLSIPATARCADIPAMTTAPSSSAVTWLSSLDDAYKQSQRDQKPIFVCAGAVWCGPCQKLHEEMEKPAVQKKLAEFTCVYIDVDKSPEAAKALGVRSIPALRALTALGESASSTEGLMSGDELIAWLDSAGKSVSGIAPAEEFTGTAAPDGETLVKLMKALCGGQVAQHEAAIRRLVPHAKTAAPTAVEILASGKLRDRLAVIDLLDAWHAPITGIDPWQPETITEARLTDLREWAKHVPPTTAPSSQPSTQPRADISTESIEHDLSALIDAPTDAEAMSLRERLAREDPTTVRAAVAARLRTSTTDRQRERLTALQLRLACTDHLLLAWPGGIERLASSDAGVRHAALNEFSSKLQPDDAPLLLQLFTSPDPFVRETSLRLLRTSGADSGSAALAALLNDPEPNVRAAVLKQFAESPDAGVVQQVIRYLPTEHDTDLVVHAARVLRASKNNEATAPLVGLLSHQSWRVRAEAVDALVELKVERMDDNVKAALRKLLDDPDGYVVGRATLGILQSGDASLIGPVFAAAHKHPELLPEVLTAIGREPALLTAALPSLRPMATDPQASVRRSAITLLSDAEDVDATKEILVALGDPDEGVRIAAAQGVVASVERLRPQNGMVNRRNFFGMSKQVQIPDVNAWYEGWRAGKDRPRWLEKAVPPLERMLVSNSGEEQSSAAVALIAAGESEKAFPVLIRQSTSTASSHSREFGPAIALTWLPFEKRLQLFLALLKLPGSDDVLTELTSRFSDPPDVRAADALWRLVEPVDSSPDTADAVIEALQNVYSIRPYEQPQLTAARAPLLETMKSKVGVPSTEPATQPAPSDMQRLVALVLLLDLSHNQAASTAEKIVADAGSSEWSRIDALQIQFLALPVERARSVAVTALKSDFAPLRKVALPFLATGTSVILQFHGSIRIRYYNSYAEQPTGGNAPQAVLTLEMLKPLIADPDPQLAAYAGYLAATLGDPAGIDPLLKQWRQSDRSSQFSWLLTQAIVQLKDDDRAPLLEEIWQWYRQNEPYQLRNFLQTISPLTGPKVSKLRERFAKELPNDNQL